jgi:hypothetical protein
MSDDTARQEAERRYERLRHPRDWQRDAFVAGAAWQAAQPVSVSAEQVREAVSVVLARGEWGDDEVTIQVEFLAALGITVTEEADRG